jgi:GntR family transcriptional regulator
MLTSVDIRSNVAVYLQIENHVQFAISSGTLSAGDQLPSVRELSDRLHVNPNTVAKAYRDLEVMGLLYTRRGMGVFINKNIESKCREECKRRLINRLHEVTSEAKAMGLNKKDITEIVDKSMALESNLYEETPASLLSLAKKKAKK